MKPRVFRVQSYPKIDAAPLREAWASDEQIRLAMKRLENELIEATAGCFPAISISHLREEPMSDIESKRDAVVKAANEYVTHNTVGAYQDLRAATDALRTEEHDQERENYAPWSINGYEMQFKDERVADIHSTLGITPNGLKDILNHIERRIKDLEDR